MRPRGRGDGRRALPSRRLSLDPFRNCYGSSYIAGVRRSASIGRHNARSRGAGKTSPQNKLKRRFGPTALVTGASDGIGRAFATRLAELGFDLILVAMRETTLRELSLDLSGRFGVDVRVLAMDLTDTGAVAALLAETDDAPVGLVIAAAGFGSIGPFPERNVASEINMVDLNCRSVVELAHGFGQRMVKQGRGGIVTARLVPPA